MEDLLREEELKLFVWNSEVHFDEQFNLRCRLLSLWF